VVDLAYALGAKKIIQTGIRPGEKFHETLLGAHEMPRCLEMKDHYILTPYVASAEQGEYRSDTNTAWLDREELARRYR